MRTTSTIALLFALAPGCRGEPADTNPAAKADAAPPPALGGSAAQDTKPKIKDGRELPGSATFADLIKLAGDVSASEKGASEAGCNLRRDADGSYRFEASVSAEKFAAPPDDLDDVLVKGEAGIRLMTGYGVIGVGAGLTLRPLSPLPKVVLTGIVPALFVTDRGVYIRIADTYGTKLSGDKGPMPESDVPRVKAELAPRPQAIVVTAESGVKLDRVHEVLSWVKDASGPVVLATPVEKGAALPKLPAAAKGGLGVDACPRGGLMDIPKGSKPGSFGDQAFFGITEAYRKDALTCIEKLSPESSGGKIDVQMRIEPDGKISKACIDKDSTGDAAVKKCVLDRTRAYVYPKPTTPGIVNFGTELSFSPKRFNTKALCN